MSQPHAQSSLTIPKAVDVAQIESELAKLWQVERSDEEDSHGVTRVCMSNLIIFSSDHEAMQRMSDEIGQKVRQQPARALLLVGEPDRDGNSISAHLSA
jgi:hypothetical protein